MKKSIKKNPKEKIHTPAHEKEIEEQNYADSVSPVNDLAVPDYPFNDREDYAGDNLDPSPFEEEDSDRKKDDII
ncbi:MAG: hypothetical protein ABI723_09270 [Bacteroidia bacterium]